MDLPRKKLKTRKSPSAQHHRVPESPPMNHNGHNVHTQPGANIAPRFALDTSLSTERAMPMPNMHANVDASYAQNIPSRPNMAIRKAGFPSQMLHPTSTNGAQAVSSNDGSNSAQQFKQHVEAHRYVSPGNGSVSVHESSAHNGGLSHAPGRTQYLGQYATETIHDPGHYAQGPPSAISPLGGVGTSIASQYSGISRPRPRLMQQGSRQNEYGYQANSPEPSHAQYIRDPPYTTMYSSESQQIHPGNNGLHSHVTTLDVQAIAKLAEVFPHLPDAMLRRALVQARGHVLDAQALIADNRIRFDSMADVSQQGPVGSNAYSNYGNHPQISYAPQTMSHSGYVPAPNRMLPTSTKREIKAPNLSIRQKQALRTAQVYPGQYPPQNQMYQQNPYNVSPYNPTHSSEHHNGRFPQSQRVEHKTFVAPKYEAPKLRTRAVKKGPKIDIGSDESEDFDHIELDSEGPDEEEEEELTDGEESEAEEVIVPHDFDRLALESRVLKFFNTVETSKELADLAACSDDTAKLLLEARPYHDLDTIRQVDEPIKGKRPSKTRKTVGAKAVETSLESLEGYEAIDSLIAKCEDYGRVIKEAISQWGINVQPADKTEGALDITKFDEEAASSSSSDILYLKGQPSLLPDTVRLKGYQLFGVNWLYLMYQKKLSGILADEMGLGKTCQVISFLGVLLTKGSLGPHLIVVPASTLENWLRELSRFCPALKVEAYYGSQRERNDFRDQFEGEKRIFNVMVTTYQLATGAKDDRSFLRRQGFDVCVYDEGHNLKNSASSRYNYLMALKANFRVLLTGTPLQNNLKELISLLSFILPKVFVGNMDRLNTIFKIKAFSDPNSLESALLSQQRIVRAKTMMTPFILRRYKKDVLDDLPEKIYRVDYLELNQAQKDIYNEHLAMTKKALESSTDGPHAHLKDAKSAANIMMQLRKCSNHPMLFRQQYSDKLLRKMAKSILKEETFRDSSLQLVIEDMEVMTDFELNRLCLRYPTIQQYALEQDCWMNACKVEHLKKIIPEMKKNGDRILLFSQFTQTLDILEDCLDTMGITYFRLDGSTDVSVRQDLIDQYHEETDITVFLLSTKAGGFGINLACANVVIIYDSSFNPHDDKQAEDRAHRVGQKKVVQIVRLVTKNTIEEHIARLANTKLTLDSSVSGDATNGKLIEQQGERKVAQSLISQLTAQS